MLFILFLVHLKLSVVGHGGNVGVHFAYHLFLVLQHVFEEYVLSLIILLSNIICFIYFYLKSIFFYFIWVI